MEKQESNSNLVFANVNNKHSTTMKDKIDLIFSDLKNEVITEKQAHNLVLSLFNASHNTAERPPIGLKPRWLHDEQRQIEVKEAINRYINVGMKIPQEWLDEYNSYCG